MTGSRPEAADASQEELIRRAARGDLAAFARIVRLHHEDMTRIAFVITGDLDSAVRATEAAWPVAWHGLHRKRTPDALGPWLFSLAATEAVTIAMIDGPPGSPGGGPARMDPGAGPAAGGGHPADAEFVCALARMDPGDRALLALRHLAGFSMSDLVRANRRSRPSVAARLERMAAEACGPPTPSADPAGVERELARRVLAYASVPVRPVDSDAAARRARAGELLDPTHVVSVAISIFVGALVAGLPYLAMLFHRR
jgi:RNA polymerase sigma-70 factor (ECF subfamily)